MHLRWNVRSPTAGRARIYGRVGALLEVGTGFHQELTGRENVFLYGAILGMTVQEIASRFDQIVEFAGVSEFIDTPVHSGPSLIAGTEIRGPALIEEPFTVVVVPPGTTARLDDLGNYVLQSS